MDDILYGRDFYQSKDNPNHYALMFIPEKPLAAHLKAQTHFDAVLGGFYEYRYQGNAH